MGYFYDTTEKILIEQYVSEHMGEVKSKITEEAVFEAGIDLLIAEPTPERPFRSLVTCGMGAIPLELPQYLSMHRINRAELVLHLSPEWQLKSRLDWPIRLMHWLSRLPLDDASLIRDLAIFELDAFLEHDNPYRAVMLHYCNECHLLDPFVRLPRKDRVIFMELIPLLPAELDYIEAHSAEEFLRDVHRFLPLAADQTRQPVTKQLSGE